MRMSDILVGLSFTLASAGYFFLAAALPASPSFGDPGSALLPKIIAVTTGIAGIALAATGLRAGSLDRPIVVPASAILLAGWSVLAVALMPIIHTPAALALFVLGGILIQIGRKGLLQGAVSAVLITALVYSLFHLLLDVPLP